MLASLPLRAAARVRALSAYQIVLGALFALGVALRFYGLGAAYLTYDEAFTALIVHRPLPDLFAAAAGDVHPPLSYLIYWLFVRLFAGGLANTFTLRIISALLGSLAIFQVYQIGRRLNLSRGALLLVVLLFACSPYEIQYSQDARMYAMLQFVLLAALLALLERRYWAMALWLAVGLWLQNYAWLYLAAYALAAFVIESRRPATAQPPGATPPLAHASPGRPWTVVIAVSAAAAIGAPWLVVLRAQAGMMASSYALPPLSPGQVVYPLFPLIWGVHLPDRYTAIAAALGFGLTLFAILKSLRLRQQRLLAWLVLAPMLFAVVVSVVVVPIYLFRGFIGLVAPLLILIAWAIAERASWPARAWALALVAPLLFISVTQHQELTGEFSEENTRDLAIVLAGYQPGDIVYHGNLSTYTRFLATAPAWLPEALMTAQPGAGELTPQTRRALGLCEGWLDPELVTTCAAPPLHWRRAWLIWGAAQNITGAEDAPIAQLLARYPNTRILDNGAIYHRPIPVTGGIWLLTQNP